MAATLDAMVRFGGNKLHLPLYGQVAEGQRHLPQQAADIDHLPLRPRRPGILHDFT